jgi:hypothetical protein
MQINPCFATQSIPLITDTKAAQRRGRNGPIVLQKSKVAAPRNFRENKKRGTITDSYTLNRAAKVADEFNVRGSVPSHLYTKDAPTARRIFGHLGKTTFATQSAITGHSPINCRMRCTAELEKTELKMLLPGRRRLASLDAPRPSSLAGQRIGNFFQRPAFRVDAEQRLDQCRG